MGFSFTATAQCDLCGEYLSSSDEECDHNGDEPVEYMFRRITGEKVVSVEACGGWHWYALKDMVGDDWIAYEWLGEKSHAKKMVKGVMWDDIHDIPHIQMSVDAPSGVKEHGD